MTHILIQIWRRLMQPKVWRVLGFASAIVGLLCYAFSSSFNYLFGDWNLLKILLYIVFSFIICFVTNAYSLISCVAFAIMSLSLSRQTQCGFEIDLLYFFRGCLILQLMKIKLQLFILGSGFSYSLIILRSSFSSIDAARVDDQYSQLQDGNPVVLYIDSLQLANTDIDIASSSNSNNNNAIESIHQN
ncbi:hypothetical protein P8452_43829 [Trifolium repens]|nr:exocyst complex component EXO70B1 [Trifolium repens]WJX58366.1 hypothetical protein P8452_43829 [Trifolium repens]